MRKLAAQLKGQGLRMNLWKAQAYEVKSTDESEAEAEALGMEVTGDEGDDSGTLVDVPLGDSGHLLQVDEGDADHTWAELEAKEDDGTELTYIDSEEEAHFIIPDEETEQELLKDLQEDPAYQGLLDELEAQGASIADVGVVIDEETGEAHFLVETSHDDGEAQGQWFGAGFRRPRIDGTYSLHFAIKRVGGSRVRFKPASPAVRRPVRELLEDRRSRTRLAVLYGGRRSETSRLKRAVFFHEFIRHTKLAVDATKVWLGGIEDKRAFGKPDDPFTYKIRLKRAPWLKTKLQLELLDGCDTGKWVPKATQLVRPGQVEVAWEKVKMTDYWHEDVRRRTCKFRIRDLQNGRILGPWDGPRLRRLIIKEDLYEAAAAASSTFQIPAIYIEKANLLLYGFKGLDGKDIDAFVKAAQQQQELIQQALAEMMNDLEDQEVIDPEEILEAIEWLSQFVTSPESFRQKIEEARQKYPSFDKLWGYLKLLWGKNKAGELIFDLAWLCHSNPEAWDAFVQLIKSVAQSLNKLGIRQQIPVGLFTNIAAFFNSLGNTAENMFEVIQVTHLLADTIQQILNCSSCTDEEKKELVLGLLYMMPSAHPCMDIPPIRVSPKRIQEYIAKVEVINRMLHLSWRPIAINLDTGGATVDFIATREINFRTITTFVKVYNEYKSSEIADDITNITNFISKHEDEYPGKDFMTVVINEPTSASEIEKLKSKYNNHDVPVVIIYKGEDGKWHVTCTCTDDFTEDDAQEAAEAMGYDLDNPSDGADTASSVITIPDPDPPFCTGPDCDTTPHPEGYLCGIN